MHWSCKPLVWLTVFSFKLDLKLPSAFFNVLGHSNTHVQRQRQQANLEKGQDRCHVLVFGQCFLSNANKVLDIFHTGPGHLFPRLLITVISSRFPFLSHHIEWHFYATCLYFPMIKPWYYCSLISISITKRVSHFQSWCHSKRAKTIKLHDFHFNVATSATAEMLVQD